MRRVVALVAAAVLVASACGGNDSSLVVYSGRSENLVGPIFETFTEETGIEVEVRYSPSEDLALLIQQEGDQSPADVFISQSPGAIGLLAGQGLLAELGDDTLGLVPTEYRSAGGLWVGLSGRIRVLVYNADLVSTADLPNSIFELTDSVYAARVALAPANGSFQDFVTGLRELHGDDSALDWLEGMERNQAATYANNSSIVQAVARGEIDMGLVNHYYNLRALAENPSLPSKNHFFDDAGSLVIITAAGILSTSQAREDATRLIEYLLDADAQEFFSTETFEYPLASGSTPAAALSSLASLESATYNFDDLSGGLARSRELIDASGLEAP